MNARRKGNLQKRRPRETPPRRPKPGRDLFLSGVAIALVVVAVGLVLWRVVALTTHRRLDTDEFEHIQAAWLMSKGLTIYRDFFEHHPPLLYFFLAPLIRATDEIDRLLTARVAMVPFAVAIVALVGAVAARLNGPLSGALAAALLSTVGVFQQKSIEVRPDVPATTFLLVAMLCCVGARLTAARLLAAGVAAGTALLFTPKLLFALPAMALVALWPGPDLSRVRACSAMAAGIAMPCAGVGLYLALHDALGRAVYFNISFNLAVPYGYRWGNLAGSLGVSLVDNWAFWAAGVAAVGATVLRLAQGRRPGAERRQEAVVLAATLGLAAGLMSIQVPLRQYVMALAVMLSIVSGVVGARIMRSALRATAPGLMKGAALCVVAGALLQPARALAGEDRSFDDQARALRYVWDLVPRDGRVFDCWTGLGVFRQPVFFYQFLGPDIVGALNALEADRWGEALRQALAEHPPFAIPRDPMLAQLPRVVIDEIRSRYHVDSSGLVFVRNR